jgi:hypothetical protein
MSNILRSSTTRHQFSVVTTSIGASRDGQGDIPTTHALLEVGPRQHHHAHARQVGHANDEDWNKSLTKKQIAAVDFFLGKLFNVFSLHQAFWWQKLQGGVQQSRFSNWLFGFSFISIYSTYSQLENKNE